MRFSLRESCKEDGQSDTQEQEIQNLVKVNRIRGQGRPYSGQHDYHPHPHFNQYDPQVRRGEKIPLKCSNPPIIGLLLGFTTPKTTSEQPTL